MVRYTRDKIRALEMRTSSQVDNEIWSRIGLAPMSIICYNKGVYNTLRNHAPYSSDIKLIEGIKEIGKCFYCSTNEGLQYDHIVPRTRGGLTSRGNLSLVCGPCNRRKGKRLLEEVITQLSLPTLY